MIKTFAIFLLLLSDEMSALSVVQASNVFPPYPDGSERETVPAVCQARALQAVAL
jgi:hypothetical protein